MCLPIGFLKDATKNLALLTKVYTMKYFGVFTFTVQQLQCKVNLLTPFPNTKLYSFTLLMQYVQQMGQTPSVHIVVVKSVASSWDFLSGIVLGNAHSHPAITKHTHNKNPDL